MAQTTTMTLTEFLEARIDDDEAVARAAIPELGRAKHELPDGPPYFEWVKIPGDGEWQADFECVEGIGFQIYDEGGHGPEEAEHIARHDPARVLREVAAKRAIIDGAGLTLYRDLCLKALAAIYSDHPDFREEWA